MAYDLLIKNGSVIDGTGEPARHADIAIADGRILEIGNIHGAADRVIDASDCVVAPGFIDPHTHYDAQICWDGAVHAVFVAWRDERRHGQLRRRHRALPDRRDRRARAALLTDRATM